MTDKYEIRKTLDKFLMELGFPPLNHIWWQQIQEGKAFSYSCMQGMRILEIVKKLREQLMD